MRKQLIVFLLCIFGLPAMSFAGEEFPLHQAAELGDKDKVDSLIATGIDVNAKDGQGRTALHWAAFQFNKELVTFLMSKGADVHARDNHGYTPLTWSAQRFDFEVGGGVASGGSTHILTVHKPTTGPFKDKGPVLDLLQSHGADIDARLNDGRTLLQYAFGNRHRLMAEATLARGADINAHFADTEVTLLHLAARDGQKSTVEFLLANGAEVNSYNPFWGTPLNYAIANKHREVVKLLLAKGAVLDFKFKPMSSELPMYQAVSVGDKAIVELLLAKATKQTINNSGGAEGAALRLAVMQGRRDLTELLLAKGADPNVTGGPKMRAPLHDAVLAGNVELVTLLLARGANIHVIAPHEGGVLHFAVSAGEIDIVRLLLSKGSDVAVLNSVARTAWQEAVLEGKNEIATALERHTLNHAAQHSFKEYVKAFGDFDFIKLEAFRKLDPEVQLRLRMIFKLAAKLNTPIPEEARRLFIEGQTMVSMARNPDQTKAAIEKFRQAARMAPWVPQIHYNLGVATELTQDFDHAERYYQIYLLSEPSEKDLREVKDRLYALTAKRRLSK